MKYVILHYFFILYVWDIKICTSTNDHRSRSGNYDINGFISQLLASSKFDELAEKLAEKAANRIMHIKEDQSPIDRASDDKQLQDHTKTATEKISKNQQRKGFAGKIDPLAVMNESISLSQNLMLKYKLLKKNVLEKTTKKLNETVPKNGTNDEHKENKTTDLVDDKSKKEGQTTIETTTQRNKDDVKKESVDENKNIPDDKKANNQKEKPKSNSETNNAPSSKDVKRNEQSQINQQPKEPVEDEKESNLGVEQNSGAEVKDQETGQVDNGIKEDIPSSLDEQNRNYSPSDEKNYADAEIEKVEDEPQMRGAEESIEDGQAPYFRGRETSVEENVMPSKSGKPNRNRNIGSSDSGDAGDRGSNERFPEEQSSAEKSKEGSVKPDVRREGNKVYTYNQNPEYQEYHEEMAKWKKEHPYNPADFL